MASEVHKEPDQERVANYRRILLRAIGGMPDRSAETRRRIYDRALAMAERAKGTTRSGAENLLAMNVAIAGLEAEYEAGGFPSEEESDAQEPSETRSTDLVFVPRFSPHAIDPKEMTLRAVRREPAHAVAGVIEMQGTQGRSGESDPGDVDNPSPRRSGLVMAAMGAILLAGAAVGYFLYDEAEAPLTAVEPETPTIVADGPEPVEPAVDRSPPESEAPVVEQDIPSPPAPEPVPAAPVPVTPPKSERIEAPTEEERTAAAVDGVFSRYPEVSGPPLDISPESERRMRQRVRDGEGSREASPPPALPAEDSPDTEAPGAALPEVQAPEVELREAEAPAAAPEAEASEASEDDATVAAIAPQEPAPVVEDRPASLYVESEVRDDGGAPVSWRVESVSVGDGPQDAILGAVRAFDPDMSASIYIRKNVDPSIPASGIMELVMDNGGAVGDATVASLDGVYVRDARIGSSQEVVTFPFEIASGHFGATFSESELILARNLDLLLQAQWVEFAVTLESGEKRRLVIEKGTSGSDVMGAILGPWRASLDG